MCLGGVGDLAGRSRIGNCSLTGDLTGLRLSGDLSRRRSLLLTLGEGERLLSTDLFLSTDLLRGDGERLRLLFLLS